METPRKPDRYSDEDWEVLKDLAEPDELIPFGRFHEYLRPVLAHIMAFAEKRDTDAPPIVEYLATQSDEDLRTMQWWIGTTYLEMQLWCGDMKLDIIQRAAKLTD